MIAFAAVAIAQAGQEVAQHVGKEVDLSWMGGGFLIVLLVLFVLKVRYGDES